MVFNNNNSRSNNNRCNNNNNNNNNNNINNNDNNKYKSYSQGLTSLTFYPILEHSFYFLNALSDILVSSLIVKSRNRFNTF